MFEMLLFVHSWNRWLVVIAALLTIVFAIQARTDIGKMPQLKKFGLIHLIAVDIQLLVGLVLYFFLSPTVRSALQSGAGMMKEPSLRFWAVEHMATMLIATILMHVGRVMAKKSTSEKSFATRTLVFTVLWIVITLAAIPWPQLEHGRPLFRF